MALLSNLHSFSAGPVLIAHIILIHVQRLTHDFRTALVALLSSLRLIILLGLIAHIILIHVQRLTHDFRTALVAFLCNLRLIVLLGLIATLSAFSVLHFGLQNYRLHLLQKGRNRQCKIHPNRDLHFGVSDWPTVNVRFPVWSPQRAIMLSRAAWSLFKIAHFREISSEP